MFWKFILNLSLISSSENVKFQHCKDSYLCQIRRADNCTGNFFFFTFISAIVLSNVFMGDFR